MRFLEKVELPRIVASDGRRAAAGRPAFLKTRLMNLPAHANEHVFDWMKCMLRVYLPVFAGSKTGRFATIV